MIILLLIIINILIVNIIIRSMASLFHWLLCCLCISNILLILSNMVESLGALEVVMLSMMLIMVMFMIIMGRIISSDDDAAALTATAMVSMMIGWCQ